MVKLRHGSIKQLLKVKQLNKQPKSLFYIKDNYFRIQKFFLYFIFMYLLYLYIQNNRKGTKD